MWLLLYAVGGWFLYEWLLSPSPKPTPVPGGPPLPQGQGSPQGPLTPAALTNPGPLIRGRHYFAKVEPGFLGCQLATADKVRSYAEGIGFANVRSYFHAAELPGYWPPDGRKDDSGFLGCTLWVEADWTGPSQQYAFPSQVKQAWILGPEVMT